MVIQADINVKGLRKIAFLLINKSPKEIATMPDEELVLACVNNSLYCASEIKIVKGELTWQNTK